LWWHPAVSADGVADGGEWVAAAERHAALRQAFSCLPPDSQQLIALLIADPPVHYAEISARLGIPVGTIGPNPQPLPGHATPVIRPSPRSSTPLKPPNRQQNAQAAGRSGK
jgi:hypothetical protein